MYKNLNFDNKAVYGDEIIALKAYDAENQPKDGAYLLWVATKLQGVDSMLYEHFNALRVLFRAALERFMKAAADKETALLNDADAAKAVRLMVEMEQLSAEKYLPLLEKKPEAKKLSGNPATGEAADKYAVKVIFANARTAVFELDKAGLYKADVSYEIYVNGAFYKESDKVIESIYGLKPATEYEIAILQNGSYTTAKFTTAEEYVTLDVKKFGAVGDGEHDDTLAIQCAIAACPEKSRVLIPAGTYRVKTIFLKSDLTLELAKDAKLIQIPDRSALAIMPGRTESYDENEEMLLGSWEGNPLSCFAALITGIRVKNVVLCGEGILDGGSSHDTWWKDPKKLNVAWRPRLFFLNNCENVVMQGVQVQNSPSWNIHPTFSKNLRFLDVKIKNPANSPNTDGLDPESCENVEIAGVHFSVGDDCIAVKSGKIYMGSTYKVPCSNLDIRHCCMRDGHGSVTLGSEMAGGVKNLTVRKCNFIHTDRGLRIKTRRGRGKDAVIDGILFEDIEMDNVMTPVVINEFYFCDPDGHSDYVQDRSYHEPDDRLPYIGNLTFRNLECLDCHAAGAYMYGLPEKKIGPVSFENVKITFAENPVPGRPAMMDGAPDVTRVGLFAANVEELNLVNVSIEGYEGEKLQISDVDKVVIK